MPISKFVQSADNPDAASQSIKVILCFEGDDLRTRADEIEAALCLEAVQDLRSFDGEYHATLEMLLHSLSHEDNWDLATYVLVEFLHAEQFNQSIVTLQLMDCGYKGAFHYYPTICKTRWAPIITLAKALLSIDEHASSASVDIADLASMAPDLIDNPSSESIQDKLCSVGKIMDSCHELLEGAIRVAVSEARIG